MDNIDLNEDLHHSDYKQNVNRIDSVDILIFETIGTMFFAYGIFTSLGNNSNNLFFQPLS